jgi:hypothetical protein
MKWKFTPTKHKFQGCMILVGIPNKHPPMSIREEKPKTSTKNLVMACKISKNKHKLNAKGSTTHYKPKNTYYLVFPRSLFPSNKLKQAKMKKCTQHLKST